MQVGSLELTPCKVLKHALCGSIRRAWEPGNPDAGSVKVGFAFVPARNESAVGTLVPHEGGPGYSTTDSASYYAEMYGPLLKNHNLLLVDQRGTGRSHPVRCPDLQHLVLSYAVAAGRCGRSLGDRADDFTTVRSADDLAKVIERLGLDQVSVYGDSYGTFFTQVFTGRHPELVESVVLDSAYPAYGEAAWYPTQTKAMRQGFEKTCNRSPACRASGRPFLVSLRAVLAEVRAHPWTGTAYDADGVKAKVVIDAPALADVAFGATFVPTFYREMTAALRTALRGDRAPLFRLVAEAQGGGVDAGPVVAYSEGLDAAVICHDYPQLFDMTRSPAVRGKQYDKALSRRTQNHPGTYGPFTVREYAATGWQELDWCLRWPKQPADNPPGPIKPQGGYPDVPVLILSGELDSITTAAEGDIVKAQFPNAKHVVVANSLHVTAVGDRDNCAVHVVRAFIRSPGSEKTGCAVGVEPIRAMGAFPQSVRKVGLGRSTALTVADVVDRWWNNYSGTGVGLHGGTFTYTGSDVVHFKLHNVRLLRTLAVSGTAVWDRNRKRMDVALTLSGARAGSLKGSWRTRDVGAEAKLHGRVNGRAVVLKFPAP